MASIHRLSSVKPLSEFDIFSVPPTQTTIEQDLLNEYRPVSTLDSKSFIEFNISSGIDEYIRLDKTWICLKLRVIIEKPLKSEVAEKDWAKVSTVNNLLNSLFKQVDFSIGDKLVSPPHQTYAYKTDFEIKLGKSKEAKDTFMATEFWFEDLEENPEDPIKKINQLIKFESSADYSRGKLIDLIGRIHLSMFEQPKALLGGCNLRLRFIPNDPSFYMKTPPDVRIKSIDFNDCALFIHKSKISRPVLEAHLKALEIAPAKYQLRESFVIPVTINKGTQDTIIDQLHNGQFPKRAFVAFVDHAAFNGSYSLNPFNYQHFNWCQLQFFLNGIAFPDKPFTPDFENNIYSREYLSLFEVTNQDNIDSCITIKKENYASGNAIIGVNFSPDLSTGCCATGHVNPIKSGHLRLAVKFSKALEKTITALVYLDYDTILEIDRDRNPFNKLN